MLGYETKGFEFGCHIITILSYTKIYPKTPDRVLEFWSHHFVRGSSLLTKCVLDLLLHKFLIPDGQKGKLYFFKHSFIRDP